MKRQKLRFSQILYAYVYDEYIIAYLDANDTICDYLCVCVVYVMSLSVCIVVTVVVTVDAAAAAATNLFTFIRIE